MKISHENFPFKRLKKNLKKWVCVAFCLGAFLTSNMVIFAADSTLPGSSKVVIGGEGGTIEPEVELKIGDTAPDFTLPNLATDKMESLKDYLGKPIILFFIQSACYSCLQEAKALKTLKEQNPGLEIIAVGVDLLGKPMLVSWAAHNNINYPVLLDPIFSVPEKYGFSYTPCSVIIGKDGKIVYIHAGFRADDIKEFEKQVSILLNQK
ncbi:MAG: TlpA family protein disulfide reductase [Candidatus Riflebacteria bacterium]|nr:TlpA family protein disulfide reductase [Candidatus Riflebacteria bacterium]